MMGRVNRDQGQLFYSFCLAEVCALTIMGTLWFSAAVNYAGFAAVLLLRPATPPLLALVVASLGAMMVSYLGMRFGVFQDPAES